MDISTALQPGTSAHEPSSTVLNPKTIDHISGAGKPALSEADDSGSIESVLEAELADLKAKETKPEPKEDDGKDKPDAKDAKAKDEKDEDKPAKARADDGKFAKAADKAEAEPDAKAEKGAPEKVATEQAGSERRTSEGRHPEPPARFLPEARAKWANVPNEVKAEFQRVSQEMEQESQQFRASHDRYSQLKDFDDLARSNGRDLRESLTKVNEVENAMAQNPIAGLDAVLREIGPRKADGSPLTIMDVANYLTQNPQAYQSQHQQRAMPQPAAQPQTNHELQELRDKVLSLEANQTVVPVIEKFAADKTDFDALADKIEPILKSGVIEQLYGTGLSLEQKLSEAYRMAGGQGPASRFDTETLPSHSDATPARPVNPDAGKKSVRGAPADGTDTSVEEPETDLREMLRKQLRATA
jgi:phage-related protein